VMDLMIASLQASLRVPVRHVQAVYRALAAPGVYLALVEESGWTPEEFERWVGDELERYLADDVAPATGPDAVAAPRRPDGVI
jgi:hypothetical protein